METLAKTEESELDSMRVATANILKEIKWGEGGAEIRKGTKHFQGGAKVYIIDYFPGMCESVTVVGHHRASGRYIELSMPARHLENFRMSTAYSPKVLELIREHYSGGAGATRTILLNRFAMPREFGLKGSDGRANKSAMAIPIPFRVD